MTRMSPGAFGISSRPDWVMCGVTLPSGGVRLIASKELTRADLEAQWERAYPQFDTWEVLSPPFGHARITLTTEIRGFVMIEAPDYPAAFKALFEDWAPQAPPRPGISEGQQELTT
jgi:hypothetical protein